MGRSRGSLASTVIVMLSLSLHARIADAAEGGDYFSKRPIFILLDILLLSSPLTGLTAIISASDPRWIERPKSWRHSREMRRYAREWLTRQALFIWTMRTLSILGIAIFLAHLAGFV